jgi:zinc protease
MPYLSPMRSARPWLPPCIGFVLIASGLQAQQPPDRSRPPELGAPPSLHVPPLQHFTLSNGLPVILIEKHDVPLVHINLVVKAGRLHDPLSKGGLAAMTLDMLMAGTSSRDAFALAEAVEFIGASLSMSTRYQISNVELHTPRSKLDDALALMAEVVLRPSFPAVELERLRVDRLTNLARAHSSPDEILAQLFHRVTYGEAHPYGYPGSREEGIRAIAEADLRAFHTMYFRPNNSTLIVAGDVTPETILPRLEAAYGAWEAVTVPVTRVEEPKQIEGRTIYLVDRPGAPQSLVRLARIGATRATEDYYARFVMTSVLSTRLRENLRGDKGYTYTVGAQFGDRSGAFLATSAIRADATGPALREFMKEFRGILEPVPEEELERTKSRIALPYSLRFERVQTIAQEIEPLAVFDLPDSHVTHWTERILSVTQDEVLRVAREYIDPDNLAIIIIGDRAVVEEQVRALDLGPIRVLSVEDVLGPLPSLDGGRDD